MDWNHTLTNDRSKETIQKFVDDIIADPKLLPNLIELIDTDNHNKSQYIAAWILGYLSSIDVKYFEPHLDHLLRLMETPDLHPTIYRSITRLFQELMLPEPYHGKVVDISFKILTSEEQLAASRCNCMTILTEYAKLYPELLPELKLVIEEILEYKKDPSIQSRGIKVLKKIHKMQKV